MIVVTGDVAGEWAQHFLGLMHSERFKILQWGCSRQALNWWSSEAEAETQEIDPTIVIGSPAQHWHALSPEDRAKNLPALYTIKAPFRCYRYEFMFPDWKRERLNQVRARVDQVRPGSTFSCDGPVNEERLFYLVPEHRVLLAEDALWLATAQQFIDLEPK